MDTSIPASRNTKLQDRLKLEGPNMSYVENIPPASSVNRPKQKEELIKYMSNVPSYLEKGENRKEKALNVGVLDFRRLEKWQSNHKPMSQQSSRCSPSTSNSSSVFTTDESSTRSSRARSSSPARPRMRRQSLGSHLNASPIEAYSQGVKTAVTEHVGKYEYHKASPSNPLKGQPNIFGMYQPFGRNKSGIKLKEYKEKDTEPETIPNFDSYQDLRSDGLASWSKGKEKIQDGEPASGLEECQELCSDGHHIYYERRKSMVVPRNDAESSHSAETRRRSISEGSFSKQSYNAYRYSDFPHSCPLPCENDNINDLWREKTSSVDAKSINLSHIPSQTDPCSTKISSSPSRGKKMREKSNPMPQNSTEIKPPGGSDLKKGTVEAPKSRNPSPTRRLINGLGWIARMSNSKESSENVTAIYGSDKPVASSCVEDSGKNKSNGKGRSQSSPLRRLLDPLLKPKASNSQQFAESSERDPSSVERACKSSTVHPVKVKLGFSSCKTVVVDDSLGNKKQGSSTVQALLQIVIKNGLPLFTFAVDNSRDILAATMRKDEKCWIYKFFTVHELKKKNGRINQSGKVKSRSYIPNAVAEMIVSDSQFSNLARHNSGHELTMREFVLFGVDLKQADQHTSNLQTNDELAAIVIEFQEDASRCLVEDGKRSDNDANALENVENGSAVQSQDLLCATVILPSGVHGLSSKGQPSSLIKRWKSGGLCDCGGWDMGCRLRVLANQTKLGGKSSSANTRVAADRFELFSQGEALDDVPVLSLSSFKDGIFSVEFNSSLAFLQAFSICIAVLSCRKPYEFSELSKVFEDKSSEQTAVLVNNGIKSPNQVPEEALESYASFRPLSPIGRV